MSLPVGLTSLWQKGVDVVDSTVNSITSMYSSISSSHASALGSKPVFVAKSSSASFGARVGKVLMTTAGVAALSYAVCHVGRFCARDYRRRCRRRRRCHSGKPYAMLGGFQQIQGEPLPEDVYDVVIVGAGPSGATCAYYLAKAGKKVLLLDKKQFPRDKYCGDAITPVAQRHLQEMGALAQLYDDNQVQVAHIGGLVTPGGLSFIGNSKKVWGDKKVIAVKRIHMDEKIVRAAQRAGVNLKENSQVTHASLAKGFWSVYVAHNDQNTDADDLTDITMDDHRGDRPTQNSNTMMTSYRARVLVCADGAPSRLARQLGIISNDTQHLGVCSRAFIKAGTHAFKADGLVFYNTTLLPGYSSIFRHVNDELGVCVYIIPGGPLSNDDLPAMHDNMLRNDPYMSKALGPRIEVERMKAATLRLGGEKKTAANQCLVIGDAAGHIDPLTGEGIQYAMDGAEIASQVLVEALAENDLSEERLMEYQEKWQRLFGGEFWWSDKMSRLLLRYPFILDGAARLIQKKGADYFAQWGEVMTGERSKTWFLYPHVGLPIGWEILKELVRVKVLKKKANVH